ncbi:IclR family transcriptional regulator [Prauserella shujinwangii]|uniref:Glycerol operon regulatory protein n=1 Tax=Prauserella shujinwangii TaxID=1453103 RepID=A0A2T0M107_9PSEU|nr:IclR family transcriptional regulator C-terminal domain-containing protein [Prauserella shujinwangii]PRX50283.1 IclR family transcriptional regulator [Prauserella shujinwangii]
MPEATTNGRQAFGPHFVQSVARALAVIRSFSDRRPTLTLSEAAQETGLDRATARRLLLTLADLGYVRTDGRHFELTPRTLELGYAYLSSLSLPEIARPHLRELSRRLNETATLTVLDGDEIVYVGLVASTRLAAVQISLGTRFAAYATSMGRVLLAGLPDDELEKRVANLRLEPRTERTVRTPEELRAELYRIREQGWALVDGELETELRGAAAPVRDRSGEVVAAVNVSVHADRIAPDTVAAEYVPEILRTVGLIERDLAGAAG